MHKQTRLRSLLRHGLFVLAGIALGSLLTWAWTVSRGENGVGSGTNLLGSPVETFSISGEISTSLAPGAAHALDLEIANPNDLPLIVIDVQVVVLNVEAPNSTTILPCSTNDFVVTQLESNLELVIRARSSNSLSELDLSAEAWPHVGMLDSDENQDGCKGATVTLEYSGSGRLDR